MRKALSRSSPLVIHGILQFGLEVRSGSLDICDVLLIGDPVLSEDDEDPQTEEMVLIGGCDKTVPAQLMGAASAGVPALALTGGPSIPGSFKGRPIGVGYDLWKATDDSGSGRLSAAEYAEFEGALMPSAGHCNEMGTASTMASLCEALGVSFSGGALAPAVGRRRTELAEESGRRAVELADDGPTLEQILTRSAFENAITLLMALGGATNAVVHLLALAGRVGVDLNLDDFDRIARRTPVLVDVAPAGRLLVDDLDAAGGIPAVMSRLRDRLALDAETLTGPVAGKLLREPNPGQAVIASLENPFQPPGGIAVLRGNLAPRGALIKRAASSGELLAHRGPALVFEGIEDLAERIDDPALEVSAESVLVLRNAGPVGAPGMPEWGMLPIPKRLLEAGVRDMVRVSDARMSGTAFGTVVLHVAPEAAIGGPLAAVRDGDTITALDVEQRQFTLEISDEELVRRLESHLPPNRSERGYRALYRERVLQADEGCDFDFLRGLDRDLPRGLDTKWVGGWWSTHPLKAVPSNTLWGHPGCGEDGGRGRPADRPPSITRELPVMNEDSSAAR